MMSILASIIVLHGVATSATLCDGLKLDHVTTYREWLRENALDLNIASGLKANQELLNEARYRAYVQQSGNVKRGQVSLCGQVSSNW
jgi:hypothetical protein